MWHSVKELYFSTTATARYHNERQPYPSKLGLLPSWLGLGDKFLNCPLDKFLN